MTARPRPCRTCSKPFIPKTKDRYCSAACRCGTNAGYLAGCHCTRCRAAHSRVHETLRMRPKPYLDPTGTRRRIRALACLGWDTATLSRRVGRDRTFLSKTLRTPSLTAETVELVQRLYDELSMTWCTGRYANRTASRARQLGWSPPLAWDDETIDDPKSRPHRPKRDRNGVDQANVERVLAGDWRLLTTKAEKTEVAARWAANGGALEELARFTGWNVTRYYRHRDQGAA